MGFTAPKVRFFAKYASASQVGAGRDAAPSRAARAYQFLIAGVPEIARILRRGRRRALSTYKLNVVDLPGVKKIRVTYHLPVVDRA